MTTVNFRGEEHDVEYINHGYDSSTNSHKIDWWFVELVSIELTDDEEQNIYDQLHKYVSENPPYFDDDVI